MQWIVKAEPEEVSYEKLAQHGLDNHADGEYTGNEW